MSSNTQSDVDNPLNNPLLTETDESDSVISKDEDETGIVSPMGGRFRGFLPVVIDMETGGFNHNTDALLEVAAVTLRMDEEGMLAPHKTYGWHVSPFDGANLEPASLEVNGIDPNLPFRQAIAVDEKKCLDELFSIVRKEMKLNNCKRAILVGHNAAFDLNFLNAAVFPWDANEAHSAVYDTEKTADLFCNIINQWEDKIGTEKISE